MPTPYYSRNGIVIYHGDCREVLPDIGSFDLLLADPPYNVGKDYGTCKDRLPEGEYAEQISVLAAAGYASAQWQAWFTPKRYLGLFAGLFPLGHLVVIRRGASGPYRMGWADQFDLVMTVGKPLKLLPDLWDDIRLKGEGYFFREETFGHPGYTPAPAMRRLISILSPEGGSVVDPFCGTGTSLRMAKDLGRSAIGIEVDEHWCEVAARRLEQEVLPL